MKRGDIWEADVGGKAGRRPVLVLSRSVVIPYLSKVVVVEITTQSKGYPTQVEIKLHGNLKKDSYVSCDCLHTLPKDRLTKFIGELPIDLLDKVSQTVIFALDLQAG